MDVPRLLGAGVVSLTGIVLIVPTVVRLLSRGEPLLGVLLGGIAVAVGTVLILAGGWLYQGDFTTQNVLRVAGWNTLGVVVLGVILTLALRYQPIETPLLLVANVVGVSAAAHVLIGIHDARRIRAEELARERKKLAVINRLVRHNLRNDAQVFTGFASELVDRTEDESLQFLAKRIREKGDAIGAMNEHLKQFQRAIDREADTLGPIDLRSLVTDTVDDLRDRYPEATITVDIPDGLLATGDDQLGIAVEQLVRNAIEHNTGDDPRVEITARTADARFQTWADLTVSDNGPGIPDSERAIITDDREITQLEHASGLGLWVVRAIAESYGGKLNIETDEQGSTVTLRLPRSE